MKTVQTKLLKTYNAIITCLIALLGFSTSCEPVMEYGTPSAKFIVKGKVSSSETSLPIKRIQVVMQGDTVFTDDNGNYRISDDEGFPTDQTYNIQFKDIDNLTNGEFNDLDTIAEFKNPKFTNGDGWYEGETTKTLDVKLTPKK
jgi:putative lipoprotein (rSAM/lipoprotein system)